MKQKTVATVFAILAAALYAINIPLSKLLLQQVAPTMMAAFLYLGAGFGLLNYGLLRREKEKGQPLTRAELPYTIGMIVLDIAAPILLMLGLRITSSANASLLNNFEIVATSLIAFFCVQGTVVQAACASRWADHPGQCGAWIRGQWQPAVQYGIFACVGSSLLLGFGK